MKKKRLRSLRPSIRKIKPAERRLRQINNGYTFHNQPGDYPGWARQKAYVILNAARRGEWGFLGAYNSPRGSRYLKFLRDKEVIIIRISNHGHGDSTSSGGSLLDSDSRVPAGAKIRNLEVLSYKNTQFGFQIEAAIRALAGFITPRLFEAPAFVTESILANLAKTIKVS